MPRCKTCGGDFLRLDERGYCAPKCWPEIAAKRRAELEAAAKRDAEARQAEAAKKAARKARKAKTRFSALNTFVDATLAELTGAETKVWLILFRDVHNGVARTGQADIARRAGLTVRGVQKAIQKLEAKGLIEIAYRGRLNQGPSCYRLRAVKS
jgi:CRP-like cAMP-binding protein